MKTIFLNSKKKQRNQSVGCWALGSCFSKWSVFSSLSVSLKVFSSLNGILLVTPSIEQTDYITDTLCLKINHLRETRSLSSCDISLPLATHFEHTNFYQIQQFQGQIICKYNFCTAAISFWLVVEKNLWLNFLFSFFSISFNRFLHYCVLF